MDSGRKNQRNQILEVLISARGNDVPSVELGRISLQYGARIKELRELGFTISLRSFPLLVIGAELEGGR